LVSMNDMNDTCPACGGCGYFRQPSGDPQSDVDCGTCDGTGENPYPDAEPAVKIVSPSVEMKEPNKTRGQE
jgi:hypothetical protein